MKFGYIYKTENILNGRLYVGKKKLPFEKHYIGSGRYFKSAVRKYGKNNFKLEIIAYANSREELNELEKKYISEYRNKFGKGKLYNIANGGEGGVGYSIGHKHSPEALNKIRIKALGRKPSEETLQKMRNIKHKEICSCATCKSHRGELVHLATCQCISCRSKRGEYKPKSILSEIKECAGGCGFSKRVWPSQKWMYCKKCVYKLRKSMKGVPRSEEAKQNMRGILKSEETKNKMRSNYLKHKMDCKCSVCVNIRTHK